MLISNLTKCIPAVLIAPLLLSLGCQQPSVMPNQPNPTYTLTVNTSNPTMGIPMKVSYRDLSGATDGTASFIRSYNAGTSVVLTAPSTAGVNLFTSWTGCTSVTTVTCTVTVTANITVTANYKAPPAYTLSVTSTNPTRGAAVSVSPADNSAATNGSTSFTRSYITGTSVTLTAPSTSGGNTFSSWTGCTTATGVICNVTLTSSRAVAANYVTPLTAFALTVNSTNPASGVAVTVSPTDNNGKTSVSSGSVLSFNVGTTVTITAPAASGSQVFQSWSSCSTAAALTCNVTVTAPITTTANYYVAPVGNTYYVGPGGNNANSGTSISAPFLTLQKAANVTAPGDVVYALMGNYTPTAGAYALVSIKTPETVTAPIAYRAYPGNTPVLNFATFQGIGFGNDAAYIEVNGFTVNGNNQNVTFAQASTPDACANPGNYPQFNTGCISADARTSTGNHPHHLAILNNIVSNCAGGIGFAGSDYITISGNTVFSCGWYGASGSSAVSLLASYNTDGATGYKAIITGNKIF